MPDRNRCSKHPWEFLSENKKCLLCDIDKCVIKINKKPQTKKRKFYKIVSENLKAGNRKQLWAAGMPNLIRDNLLKFCKFEHCLRGISSDEEYCKGHIRIIKNRKVRKCTEESCDNTLKSLQRKYCDKHSVTSHIRYRERYNEKRRKVKRMDEQEREVTKYHPRVLKKYIDRADSSHSWTSNMRCWKCSMMIDWPGARHPCSNPRGLGGLGSTRNESNIP
jgi:hypothetical protein